MRDYQPKRTDERRVCSLEGCNIEYYPNSGQRYCHIHKGLKKYQRKKEIERLKALANQGKTLLAEN